jgi:hypothetical protein
LENISHLDPPSFGIVSQDALKLLQEQEELPALYKELRDFGLRLHLCQRCKGGIFAFQPILEQARKHFGVANATGDLPRRALLAK